MSKHRNLEGRTKVTLFRPLRDRDGRYIPFCDFGMHQGISKTYEICEKRGCIYYHKLYIKNENTV